MDKKGSQWVYEKLLATKEIRALKFSGDIDGAVPTYGTRNWINSMNITVTEEWRPYYVDTGGDIVNKELGGFIETYEGDLTFATIHGAGHMTPTDKPE